METYLELKELLKNYNKTFEDFYNEYSGDEINEEYMTLSYDEIDVKIYRDWTLDKEFTIYDNEGNEHKMTYEEV